MNHQAEIDLLVQARAGEREMAQERSLEVMANAKTPNNEDGFVAHPRTKFTQGRWRFEYDDNGFFCVTAYAAPSPYIVATGGESDEDKANSLLISAAPELFAAIINSDDAHWTPAMRAAMKKAVGEDTP